MSDYLDSEAGSNTLSDAQIRHLRRKLTTYVQWYDFEPEPDLTGDGSGDPETHYLTISLVAPDGSQGEEIAVICHRLCGGKYPLDGDLANRKRRVAQAICDALNATNHLAVALIETEGPGE